MLEQVVSIELPVGETFRVMRHRFTPDGGLRANALALWRVPMVTSWKACTPLPCWLTG